MSSRKYLFITLIILGLFQFNVFAAGPITVTNEADLGSAITAANSGTYDEIIIDASATGGTLTLTSALPNLNPGMGNSYVIKAANGTTVTLDGNSAVQIFAKPLTTNFGTIVFENINFLHGKAVNNSGGVFYNSPLSSIVRGTGDLLFASNAATGSSIGWGYGGVAYGGEYYFQNNGNVVFFDNNSSVNGSVGYLAKMNFSNNGDVNFLNNHADGSGGVFSSAKTEFTNHGNVLFQGNSSKVYGGVYADSSFTFRNTGDVTFSGNYLTSLNNDGGAIVTREVSSFPIIFENDGNVYFHDNTASRHGGAIVIVNNPVLRFAPQTGKVVEFKGNMQGVKYLGGVPDYSTATPNAIYFSSPGSLLLDPVKNANILFYDPISGDSGTGVITQNGPGTVKLWGDSDYDGTTTINQGRFQLMLDASYGNLNNHAFAIGSAGVFGVSIDSRDALNVNKHSTLLSQSFQADAGARLYVSGVSALPAGTVIKYEDVVQNGSPITLPQSMTISNELLVARLMQNGGNPNNGDLAILGVNNVGDNYGYELEYIDNLRLDPNLDETMRGFIDDLYNYGADPDAIDFLATLGGSYVMDSIDATRTRGEMFNQIMLGRLDAQNRLSNAFSDANTLYRGQSTSLYLPGKRRLYDRTEMWGNFTQNWTSQERTQGNDYSYTYRPFALTFGKEREISFWRYGAAGQFQQGVIDSGYLSKTRTKTDGASLGAYAGYTGNRWYAKGNMQLGVTRNKENTTYAIDGTKTSGTFATGLFGTSMDGGWIWKLGCRRNPLQLMPHSGAYYYMIVNETFSESSTGPGNYARRFNGMTHNVVEIPFGLRISKNYELTGGLWQCQNLRPIVDIMYLRSVADNVAVTQAQMFGGPISTPWNARSDDIGRDIFRLGVGLSGRFFNSVDLSVGYDLEARKRYSSQQFNASLAWSR